MKRGIYMILALALITVVGSASADDLSPRDVYRAASPAVVMIFATDGGSLGNAGAGSIISPDGLILTNSHVVTNEQTKVAYKSIQVYLKPEHLSGDSRADLGNPYPAVIVSQDREVDIAVIKLESAPAGLQTISLADSDSVSVGDRVAAIGHPEGGGLWILTTGSVSGSKKMGIQDTFQTETSINRGNSGGPLLNGQARIIGMNTSTVRQAPDGMVIVGVNFALKSNQIGAWLSSKGVAVATSKAAPIKPSVQPAEKPPVAAQAPASTPPAASAAKPSGPVEKPKTEAVKPVAPAPSEDLEKEFRGPNGELMYGRPGGRFNLDDLKKAIFARAKNNANKAFEELDSTDK